MFRRGGSTNMNGIMDGITDRQDDRQGTSLKELDDYFGGVVPDTKLIPSHPDYFKKTDVGTTDIGDATSGYISKRSREMPSVPNDVRSAPSIRNDSDSSYAETVRKIMEDYESKRVNPI